MPEKTLNKGTVYVPQVNSGLGWYGERTYGSPEDAKKDYQRIQKLAVYQDCQFRLIERTVTEVVLEPKESPDE